MYLYLLLKVPDTGTSGYIPSRMEYWMKKYVSLILLFTALIISCTTSENVGNNVAETMDGSRPQWLSKTPLSQDYLYGVGVCSHEDRRIAMKIADMEARNAIASSIQAVINSTVVSDEAGTVLSKQTVQTVDVSLYSVIIVEHYIDEDGTVYSLARLALSNLPDYYRYAIEA